MTSLLTIYEDNSRKDIIFQTICINFIKNVKGFVNGKNCVSNEHIFPIITDINCLNNITNTGIISFSLLEESNTLCVISDDKFMDLNEIITKNKQYYYPMSITSRPNDTVIYIANLLIIMILMGSMFLIIAAIMKRLTEHMTDIAIGNINSQIPILQTNLYVPQETPNVVERIVTQRKCTEDQDIDCSICIEPIKKNQMISQLECNHVFHTKCLKEWFKQSIRCPNCNHTGSSTDDSNV